MGIGIALAGGGIRGIAHAGVLKALEENNITIDAIGGTSAGSIVATLYSMGYKPYFIYCVKIQLLINLCVGFPRLFLKSLSIRDGFIVIKVNSITMPI